MHQNVFHFILMFQGLTIIAFNDGNFNAKTLREVLSLGPTFVVMKFFESMYISVMKFYFIIHTFFCLLNVFQECNKFLLLTLCFFVPIYYMFSPFHFFFRCPGHFHDVWCIFNNKALGCLTNFSTISLV